ncbi:hypothetical protein EB796_013463 [Bugula neritina]|uniref:Uncharacterized protein n=1 Tax=Bugula neritina TaxID=10212 RepID=A0A7J7JQI5_BUGNE|nr:hypothetical protein EB796_013463 [Bugula neritina]
MNGHYSKCDFFNYKRKDLAKYGNASNLQLNEKIKEMQKRGEQVYHVSFGQSPFPLAEEMVAALKKHAYRHDYVSMNGECDTEYVTM